MKSPVELKDNSIILFTWELDFEMSPLQVVDFWGILSPTIFLILKGSVYQDFDALASSCLLLLHFGDHVHLCYPILEIEPKIPPIQVRNTYYAIQKQNPMLHKLQVFWKPPNIL